MKHALAFGAACALLSCGPGHMDSDTAAAALRPDDPRAPLGEPQFDASETVESWVSPGGRVRVHFTRMGRNAVPARDDDMSGTPDYVELTGTTYDNVRTLYHGSLGLREPVSDALLGGMGDGGDDLFDVYLVDFGGRGDGAFRTEACKPDLTSECTGFMIQENDFAGYNYPSLNVACSILGSHEYFHAVQAAYDSYQDVIFSESTAVWGTERFVPALEDFEGFIEAYLTRTDRPINVVSGGVVDAKSYGTAIFFQFLDEKYDPQVVVKLLDAVVDGANGVDDPEWFDQLDPFLRREYGVSFAEAFVEFSIWNLYTGRRADSTRSYQRGGGYPALAIEEVTLPYTLESPRFFPASARYFGARPEGRAQVSAALAVTGDQTDELAHLQLFVTAVRGETVAEPTRIQDVRAGTETIGVANAEQVIAFVINTSTGGNSRRPDLCLGDTDEVSACLRAVAPPDAGVPDSGGGSPDAGVAEDSGGTPTPEPEDEGCACTASSGRASAWLLFAAFALFLRRSRR